MRGAIRPKHRSTAVDSQAQNFPGLTFGGDLEGPAAHLAVRGEGLGRLAGVKENLKLLAAKRALNRLGCFHKLPRVRRIFDRIAPGCSGVKPAGKLKNKRVH
jgi:hypothetical protein